MDEPLYLKHDSNVGDGYMLPYRVPKSAVVKGKFGYFW